MKQGQGTTISSANHMMNVSNSGVRHGNSNKNVKTTANRKPTPTAPTSPIKGSDRGGV